MNSWTQEAARVHSDLMRPEIERTIRRAIEITEREGYSVREWMWALNLAAGNVPQNLRISAEVLRALSAG